MANVTRDWIIRVREQGAAETRAAIRGVGEEQARASRQIDLGSSTVDRHGRVLGFTRDEIRKYREEQRLQGFVVNQTRQGIVAATTAITALAGAFGEGGKQAEQINRALFAGIGVMNALEFAAFSLGLRLSPMIAIAAGAAAAFAVLTSKSDDAKRSFAEQKAIVDALAGDWKKLPLAEQEALLRRVQERVDSLARESLVNQTAQLASQDIQVEKISESYRRLGLELGIVAGQTTPLAAATGRSIEAIAREIGVREKIAERLRDEIEMQKLLNALKRELGIEEPGLSLEEQEKLALEIAQGRLETERSLEQLRQKFFQEETERQFTLQDLVARAIQDEREQKLAAIDLKYERERVRIFQQFDDEAEFIEATKMLEAAKAVDIARLKEQFAEEDRRRAEEMIRLDEERLRKLRRQYAVLSSLSDAVGDTIRSGIGGAWEQVFGEANSLFEQMLASWAARLAQLAAEWAATELFQMFLNFLLPGAGTAVGIASGGFGMAHEGAIIRGGFPLRTTFGGRQEVMVRALEGEEILSPEDPRHARNVGSSGVTVNVVLNVDARAMIGNFREVERSLMSRNVQRAIVRSVDEALRRRRTL